MKSVIKAIVFLIMGFTVILYGGALLLPGEARVERSVDITAPPDKVYAIVSDLRRLPEWSPWTELDPATAFTFEGAPQAPGQVMRWASNNPLVGSGTMTVVDAESPTRIVTRSDYGEFGASSATMSLAPQSGGTRLTWTFESTLPGVFDRWAGLGIDSSVGAEYEKGLRKLKALAEQAANY